MSPNVRNGFLLFSSGIEMENWQCEISWIEQKDRLLSCCFLRYQKKKLMAYIYSKIMKQKKKKERETVF